jgi:pimeloyl-ACP methyl ester carboxylesterase
MKNAPWILLRGWTREAAHWGDFPAGLADASGAEVVALDLPGVGSARETPCPLRIDTIAAALRERLASRGVPPPYRLLGLSMGGMVALAWSARWPAEIAHGVCINTSVRGLTPPTWRLQPAALRRLVREVWRHDPAALEATVLGVTSNRLQAPAGLVEAWCEIRHARPVDWSTALRQAIAAARFAPPPLPAGAPLTLICSSLDRLVHPACSRRLAHRLQCPLLEHPDAGHDLPLDAPGWLVAQLQRIG